MARFMEKMHIILRYLAKELKEKGYKISRSSRDYFYINGKDGIELKVKLAKIRTPYLVDVILCDKEYEKEKKIIKYAIKIAGKIDDLLMDLFQSSLKKRVKYLSRLGFRLNINLGFLSLSPQYDKFRERGEKIEMRTMTIRVGLYTRLVIKAQNTCI